MLMPIYEYSVGETRWTRFAVNVAGEREGGLVLILVPRIMSLNFQDDGIAPSWQRPEDRGASNLHPIFSSFPPVVSLDRSQDFGLHVCFRMRTLDDLAVLRPQRSSDTDTLSAAVTCKAFTGSCFPPK